MPHQGPSSWVSHGGTKISTPRSAQCFHTLGMELQLPCPRAHACTRRDTLHFPGFRFRSSYDIPHLFSYRSSRSQAIILGDRFQTMERSRGKGRGGGQKIGVGGNTPSSWFSPIMVAHIMETKDMSICRRVWQLGLEGGQRLKIGRGRGGGQCLVFITSPSSNVKGSPQKSRKKKLMCAQMSKIANLVPLTLLVSSISPLMSRIVQSSPPTLSLGSILSLVPCGKSRWHAQFAISRINYCPFLHHLFQDKTSMLSTFSFDHGREFVSIGLVSSLCHLEQNTIQKQRVYAKFALRKTRKQPDQLGHLNRSFRLNG